MHVIITKPYGTPPTNSSSIKSSNSNVIYITEHLRHSQPRANLSSNGGEVHENKQNITLSASSLLSTETSIHDSFSAWLPQLVLNKREGVGEEKEKEKDKGSREGSQLFSGTTPLETCSRSSLAVVDAKGFPMRGRTL